MLKYVCSSFFFLCEDYAPVFSCAIRIMMWNVDADYLPDEVSVSFHLVNSNLIFEYFLWVEYSYLFL